MKNIWLIFRNDLKKIGTNLVAFIVMIGICILPALYAWFNIASNWDPYGNTKNIKIAVVNLDEGSEFGNIKIDIGSQVIENLKTNTQLGWQFVSKAEAEEGVNVGTYYASVTITKDFSANMTSILSGKLKRPQIIYTLNEKLNAIAPKITDKGAEAIKNSVNQSFIDTITTTLAETITTTAGTADSGYVKLKNDLTDNIQEIIDNIDAVETSIDLVVTAIDSSNVLLDNAKDGLPNVRELLVGAGTLSSDTKDTINGASSAASQITAGADSVITAIDSLYSQISPDIDAAFAAINEDSTSAANKFTEITKVNSKVISLESQLVTFFNLIGKRLGVDNSEIITRLNNNITQQNNIINKINEISDTLKKAGKIPENSKAELDNLVGTANQGIVSISNEFSQNVKPTVDGLIDDVFTELDGITGAMNDIDGTVPDIETALDSGKESLDALKTSLVSINKTLDNSKERMNKIVEKIDSIDDEKSLVGFIESLSFAPSDLGEFMSSPVKIQNIKVYPVENYGSAMAPFYSVLAIWVGSIVLVAVLKTEIGSKDEKRLGGHIRPIEGYFGRYQIFLFASVIQGLIIALGDLYFLKIQCVSPVLFILTVICISIVFSIFVYSLTITFSVIGKAMAVIILVLQVAGSGGTYPPELLPEFFQKLLPYLPFKYAVNGIRETVAGVYTKAYVTDMLMLLVYIAIALFIGILLRKPFLKIMNYFNHRLEATELMV